MDYLSELNNQQLDAVQSTEGNLRVIAGAGSGKTKLLVSRYAYLVKEYGIDPANILCVTFTNKAAGEMKRRIRALVGQEYDTSLICTYHGFCVRVLRDDIEKLFYPKQFQIIDTAHQKAFLADIYLKLDHASFEKIIRQIGILKAQRYYVGRMCSREPCRIINEIATQDDVIIEEFLQRQKQTYSVDFNDLMYFTLHLFRQHPEVLKKWQERLNYIQVDEFQDSSNVEMEIVDLLSEYHGNLMIVGDPDQNIYEWRGSDVKLLVDFDKTHSNTKTVFMNQNYRSTSQILRCANTLIEKNEYRLKKDLFTENPNGANVYHYHTKNEYEEADRIIEIIRALRRETSCYYADFAVMYRSGFLSRVIEKKFTEEGIPYEIFGGVKFYQRMEIQDILAYLRLIAFDDDIALKRIINKPRRRFGRVKMQRLLALYNGSKSLLETLRENIDDPAFKNSGASEFIGVIDSARALSNTLPVSDCVNAICRQSGYEQYIRELGDMERFDNLSEFKRIANEFEHNLGEEISLNEFINHISLQSGEENGEEADMVKLMTIHAAKGLEFPNVFVIGLSEGIFPSAKTIEERKQLGLEEERRLCYVAITRAEQRLFFLDSEGFSQNGNQKFPSRFLEEIGEDNYIRIGTVSKELQRSAQNYACTFKDEKQADRQLRAGDKVTHPAFGEGEIVKANGSNYRVKFENPVGERNISADYFKRAHTLPVLKFISKTEKSEISPLQSSLVNGKAMQNELNQPDNDGYQKAEEKIVKSATKITASSETKPPVETSQTIPDLSEAENLWKRDDVPKTGWVCTGVTDLGRPVGMCEMCGHQIIRYVHHMFHPDYGSVDAGCVCAGKMEGNPERAKQREQDFKNKQARKDNFMKRKWKVSKNNNSYLKIQNHLIVLYYNKKYDNWKYSLDNQFCKEVFETREEAMEAAFEAFNPPE